MNNKIKLLIFFLACLTTVYLDWEKWNIASKTTPLIIGYISLLSWIILICATIYAFIFTIHHYNRNFFIAIIPSVISVFIILNFTILNISMPVIKMNYHFNKQLREEIVRKIDDDTIEKHLLVNENLYMTPLNWRLTSHTGRIIVKRNDYEDETMVLFYVHRGRINSSIIYSDAGAPKNENFDFEIIDIEELDENWYAVRSLSN